MFSQALRELLERRIVILLGKGGVGKTTLAAAFATIAARRGLRTLAIECDPRAPLGALFGKKPAFEPQPVTPKLAVMVLEGRHSLEEYLRLVVPGGAVLNAIFASRLYQYFVNAAPGLKELMMLGKIHYESEQRNRDLIVFDAPASGQALGFLKMPFAARETFGESVVGREARNIARTLRNEKTCAVIQVTTAEPLAIAETLEAHAGLDKLGLKVAAAILNRRNPAAFESSDIARLAQHRALKGLAHLDYACEAAYAELARVQASRRALAQLRQNTRGPIIELDECRGCSGADLVERLAADLTARLEKP